jgi:hypothetical protein
MVKISDYTSIPSIADDDLFDVSQYDAVGLTYNTRSISWLNLKSGFSQTLQQTLTAGNTTAGNNIFVTSGDTIEFSNVPWTGSLAAASLTANRTYALPNQTGTIPVGPQWNSLISTVTPGGGQDGYVITWNDAGNEYQLLAAAAGSNIYGTDGTLTGNRVLSGGGFVLELGTGASKLSSLRCSSSSNFNFNGDANFEIDLSTGTGDFILNGASSEFRYDDTNGNFGFGVSSPDGSALVDIDVSSLGPTAKQGFLPPRMTTTEMNAIGTPARS